MYPKRYMLKSFLWQCRAIYLHKPLEKINNNNILEITSYKQKYVKLTKKCANITKVVFYVAFDSHAECTLHGGAASARVQLVLYGVHAADAAQREGKRPRVRHFHSRILIILYNQSYFVSILEPHKQQQLRQILYVSKTKFSCRLKSADASELISKIFQDSDKVYKNAKFFISRLPI